MVGLILKTNGDWATGTVTGPPVVAVVLSRPGSNKSKIRHQDSNDIPNMRRSRKRRPKMFCWPFEQI